MARTRKSAGAVVGTTTARKLTGGQKKTRRNSSDPNSPNPEVKAQRLANKPGKLSRKDIMCTICWSSLFEPTTLPCNHSLCQACFRKHIAETSLSCPICRLRLSVWCRKELKGNTIIDEELWSRIKMEFPRLVEARMNGEDTQNVVDDDDNLSLLTESQALLESNDLPLDGEICPENGMVANDLLLMMEQHYKDLESKRLRENAASANYIQNLQEEEERMRIEELENKRLQEETATANLIKQLQEEEEENLIAKRKVEEQDFLLAQKLQQEDDFSFRQQPMPTRKNPQRNLMDEWTRTPPDSTRKSLQSKVAVTPKTKLKKKAPQHSNQRKSVKKRKITATATSSDVSRASQDMMNSYFLSSSQNRSPQHSPVLPKEVPCCSTAIPQHDVRSSAFSPVKPTSQTSILIPAERLAVPICGSDESVDSISPMTMDENVISTKTPDSIKNEVEGHFRPIRCAPKTPPGRRRDGTFLPEAKLVKTTPIKPVTSTPITAYILSPSKQSTCTK